MAVPKRRTSRSKKNMRRAHHALGRPNLRPCSNCGEYGLSHRVCPNCGFYAGKLVISPKIKVAKEG